MRFPTYVLGLICLGLLASGVSAGPIILAGTDADDHGSATLATNIDGWFFMQRALENLASAPSLTNGNLIVANLGSDPGSEAANAAASAFALSSLPGAGFTFANVSGTSDLADFFSGAGPVNVNNTAIIMMDSAGNVGGGTSAGELDVFVANAGVINSFLGGGGGLFSQSNGHAWVSALLPTLTAPNESFTGIELTSEGMAAFPGLSNADLSSGPYHNRFENFGGLTVLGRSSVTDNAIIIGAAAGSITDPEPPTPGPIPEPATLLLFAPAALYALRRKQRA